MKKTLALFIAITLSLSFFAGCGQVKVTQDNIRELFEPSFRAYIHFAGSEFYEIEKDENKKPVIYQKSESGNEPYSDYCKIIGIKTYEELEKEMNKYLPDYIVFQILDKYMFIEDSTGLYIGPVFEFDGTNRDNAFYDLNSISIIKEEYDLYHISIDYYGESEPSQYLKSCIFYAQIKNGVLSITDPFASYYIKEENEIPDMSETEFITTLEKFK